MPTYQVTFRGQATRTYTVSKDIDAPDAQTAETIARQAIQDDYIGIEDGWAWEERLDAIEGSSDEDTVKAERSTQ